MPTYSYRCRRCKATFDEFTSISDRDNVVCSACKVKAKRLFSPPVETTVFNEDVYWFAPNEPVMIRSKRQLLDECKRRGKVSLGYG